MNLFTFFLSFVAVLSGCKLFTNGVEQAARRFGLSEGAVGSVLAAIGTGLPETIVPIIAIFLIGGNAGGDIGTGAILGSPFMLSTVALFVCGLAVLLFARRRGTRRLKINGGLLRRDLGLFLFAYGLAAFASLLPSGYGWFKTIPGLLLFPLYIAFTLYSLKSGKIAGEGEEFEELITGSLLKKLSGKSMVTVRTSALLVVLQVVVSLIVIVAGAEIFVGQINEIAVNVRISPLVLALIISPVATELPEMFNSFLWIREKKDVYALGNITGAMAYQSCIPVTAGILLTDWHLDLSGSTGILQAAAMGLALLSSIILLAESRRDEISVAGMMIGGLLYLVFIAMVLVSV